MSNASNEQLPNINNDAIDASGEYRTIVSQLDAGQLTSLEATACLWSVTDKRASQVREVAKQIPRIFNNMKEQ